MEFAIKNPKMYSQEAVEEDTMTNMNNMSFQRELERPSWSRNGTMYKKASRKHYIPKHPFYYTAEELFESKPEEPTMETEDVNKYLNSLSQSSQGNARKAFSAPYQRLTTTKAGRKREEEPIPEPQRLCPSRVVGKGNEFDKRTRPYSVSEPLPKTASPSLSRPRESPPTLKAGNYRKTFPESVPWKLSGVPGIRVLQEHDHYRRKALDMKNTDIFHLDSGLIPKYLGYVPGFKFRHGGTFGRLTYNAREIGIDISPTWGGAVSLLFR